MWLLVITIYIIIRTGADRLLPRPGAEADPPGVDLAVAGSSAPLIGYISLSLSVYIYIYIYTYRDCVCVYIYIYIHTYIHIYIYNIYIYIYVYIYMQVYSE